jgi:peptidoglycan/xylan/chitin deacetylase (PgdA/CDA1 family)
MNLTLMLHDFEESSRRGMQTRQDSRYLLKLILFKEAIHLAINEGVQFDLISQNNENSNKVRITQDDGGGSSLLLANFLSNLGIRCTFFIATDYIGKPGFLTSSEIRWLRSLGHMIGSHSHSHPNPFCLLDARQLDYEVQKSQQILEDTLMEKIEKFAIPGGESRSDTFKALSDPKYALREVYTSIPHRGVIERISNTEFHGRFCIERDQSPRKILRVIEGNGWRINKLIYLVSRLRREIGYQISNQKN